MWLYVRPANVPLLPIFAVLRSLMDYGSYGFRMISIKFVITRGKNRDGSILHFTLVGWATITYIVDAGNALSAVSSTRRAPCPRNELSSPSSCKPWTAAGQATYFTAVSNPPPTLYRYPWYNSQNTMVTNLLTPFQNCSDNYWSPMCIAVLAPFCCILFSGSDLQRSRKCACLCSQGPQLPREESPSQLPQPSLRWRH